MTQLVKILLAVIGILALYGLWTLVMTIASDYFRRNAQARRRRARELAELAVNLHQHLAGANRYFNSATQVDEAPYTTLVSQARHLAKSGYETAGRAVKSADNCSRFEAPPLPAFYRYLVVPPLLEALAWSRHALEIRRVAGQLDNLQHVRQRLAAIDAEIAMQGQQIKRFFDELRAHANELEAKRKNLASPNKPLITEGASLAGAFSLFDMINDRILTTDDPPRQNVVDAYRWFFELQDILNEVEQKMRRRPSPAQDANFALQVALRYYSRFEQALTADTKLYGPFPNLADQLLGFKKQLEEINGTMQARDYQTASGQAQQLPIAIQAQHNTLEQVKLLRGKVSELYSQAQSLTTDYETKLANARLKYEMDISDPLLLETRRLLHNLDELRTSEDLAKLNEADQVKRDFDVKIGEVETAQKTFNQNAAAFSELNSKINRATVNEQCSRAGAQAAALSASHDSFSQACAPDVLTTQCSNLLSEWRLISDRLERPKQSQLESLLKMMVYPLQLQTQLAAYNEASANSLSQKDSDHRFAQASLHGIDALLPVCDKLAQNWDYPSLANSADYHARHDELARELNRPEADRLDYTTLHHKADKLLGEMREFIKTYNEHVTDRRQKMAALHESFEPVKLQLQDLHSSGTLDLQVDARYNIDIQAWNVAFNELKPDAPLHELQSRCDSGNRLMAESLSYIQRLQQDRESFIQMHKRIKEHAVRVRDHVDNAIQTWRTTQTDNSHEQPDRVAPIRLQLDKANAILSRLNEPSVRYTLADGHADLKLADSVLNYADLMLGNL